MRRHDRVELRDRRRRVRLDLGVHVRVDFVVDPEMGRVGHQQCTVHDAFPLGLPP
jgi:hypothetical protein